MDLCLSSMITVITKISSILYSFSQFSLILVYFTNALNGPIVTDELWKHFGQDMHVNGKDQ